MEVFIQFADHNQQDRVLKKAEFLCRITARVHKKLQCWFEPFDSDCYNEFTGWLEDEEIEYENV